ncbi:P-loop containing nucleoside triphosphate hydrolase, partial [Lasallia pustulata]
MAGISAQIRPGRNLAVQDQDLDSSGDGALEEQDGNQGSLSTPSTSVAGPEAGCSTLVQKNKHDTPNTFPSNRNTLSSTPGKRTCGLEGGNCEGLTPDPLTDGNKKNSWHVQKAEADDKEEDGEKHTGDGDKETTPLLGFTKKRGSSTVEGKFVSKRYGKRRRCSSPILVVQDQNHDTQADGTSPESKGVKTKIHRATIPPSPASHTATSPPTLEQAWEQDDEAQVEELEWGVKKILDKKETMSHPEKHLQQISSCTIGIVFLGTPHHGADLAAWAKFGSTIAKTIKHVNSDIVSVLKPGSEMLARVQDGFHGLLRLRMNEESEIAVTCFFEELSLPLVGKVVEMESAILPGYASYGIHANHMDMTKFDNKDNAGYESVLGELRRWVKGLQPAQGKPDRRDKEEAKLLETLASDYKSDKDSISVRVPGTCEWFFKDDRFLEWRDSTYSRLLWVSAGPGCGKSVLSRALIDERKVCKNSRVSTICYFFFKDGQEQRTHGTDALSAVLHQLFENTGLITYALPSYRNYGKKLRDAFSELWDILVRSARDSEVGEIVCVLDALDECEQNARKQLIEKLVSFFSQMEPHDNPSFALKFLITSRPYDDLEQNFQPLSDVSTYLHFDGDNKSQRIGQEIDLVIDAKIPSIAGDFSDEDRKRISQRLKKMDNRTYLWLFLTIDIIAGSRSKFRKVSSIDSLLSDLPSKISDAYERILTRSSDEVHARILLQLIVAARRPLSLDEANVALTLATHQGNCTSYKKLDLWPLRSFKSTIQNMCGLFVSVRDGKVSLIHQTAREFLVRNTELPELGYALTILTLMTLLVYPEASYIEAIVPNKEINLIVSTTMQLSTGLFTIFHKIVNEPKIHGGLLKTYAIYYYHKKATGLRDIDEGADINAQGGRYGNALQAASERGHDQVVRMLLDKGADVNAQGGEYGNALYAASERGHDQVVRMLLDKGADVNAQGGRYGNALYAASSRGRDQVVRMLLDKGADVDAQGG